MTDSILDSVKKVLGLGADYKVFDQDIILLINSTFSTLTQLGVGPINGFRIDDNQLTWDIFYGGDDRLNFVQTYVCLKVRLAFDPPVNSFTVAALQDQIKELEWRINVVREEIKAAASLNPVDAFYDGGGPSGSASMDGIYDGGVLQNVVISEVTDGSDTVYDGGSP